MKLGINNIDCRQDGTPLGEHGGRAGYLFNSTIAGIEEADAIILVGTNPRLEAPVLNARIRKRVARGGCFVGVIGEAADLTYKYNHLGAGTETLTRLAELVPDKTQKPMIIIGQGALSRADGAAVLALAAKSAAAMGVVRGDWNGFKHPAYGRRARWRTRCLCAAGRGRSQHAGHHHGCGQEGPRCCLPCRCR